LTHWSDRSLAIAAVEQGIVEHIDPVTVGRILQSADIKPHLSRYWKTTVWDDEAVQRALKIIWYYERIESLWAKGQVLVAVDEKPNLQVLERAKAGQLVKPGQVERQEFEYIRHGIVHLLAGLTLHTGRMWMECLPNNDGAHFRPAIRRFLHPFGWAKRIYIVLDNGSSHVSGETQAFFEELYPRVQLLYTPTNASWLNQAELLLDGFSARYISRGAWNSPSSFVTHIQDSRKEYNPLVSGKSEKGREVEISDKGHLSV
jgi:transposase